MVQRNLSPAVRQAAAARVPSGSTGDPATDSAEAAPIPVLLVRRAKTTWHIYRVVVQPAPPPRSAIRVVGEEERVASAPSLTGAAASAEDKASEAGCLFIVPTESRMFEVRCPEHGPFRTNTTEAYAEESAAWHWRHDHQLGGNSEPAI